MADVRQSGSLNQTEFIIAMHYIAKLMDGTLASLPDKLPPAVFQSAQGGSGHLGSTTTTTATLQQPSPLIRNMTISSPSVQPFSNRQIMTPPQRARTIDSLGNLAFGPSAPIHESIQHWDVSAAEKQQFDAYFDKIDSSRAGLIQGKEAVEFFKNSRLPESELAHIWDLSDIGQRGALSRDEFAIAMHLIHKRLAGESLPQTLPKSLVPPSTTTAAQQQLQSPFNNVVNSPSMFHASPAITANRSIATRVQQPAMADDLLGDFGNDSVAQETNQVNTLQNQISSMSLQTTDLRNQKQSAESVLEQLLAQKKDLEAQIAQVKMAHEEAIKDLNEIQETVRREEGDWDRVRQEYDGCQQQLTAVQNEMAQTQQTLENGRAETESLRRRVNEIQEETRKATLELEQLHAQSKQTSMMLDINRRQVTAAEQDRNIAKQHLEEYKAAGAINKSEESSEDEEEEKEEEEEGIFGDASAPVTAVAPKEQDTAVSTPALNNLFGEASPSVASASKSPFTEFATTATQNNNQSSPLFDQAFSTPAAAAVTGVIDNDFDAIFGSPSIASASTPISAFDPAQWVSSPASVSTPTGGKSSRGPPPPPPPASRHHRQTSEVSSIHSNSPSVVSASGGTSSSNKKQRAPPPPPPGQSLFTPTEQPTEEDDDDFEAAFSGKLPEAKIVTKANDDEFADFDDAFSSFDAPKATTTTTATTTTAPASNTTNWASSFGGFSFPSPDATVGTSPTTTTTTTKPAATDDDWDSIFGTGAPSSLNAAPTATTAANDGFDDAFSSFGDDFGKQPIVQKPTPAPAPAPAVTTSPPVAKSKIGSIGIVGDKIEELVKIGFNEQEAKDALNRYDQDLEKATNFLLDQSSKA